MKVIVIKDSRWYGERVKPGQVLDMGSCTACYENIIKKGVAEDYEQWKTRHKDQVPKMARDNT